MQIELDEKVKKTIEVPTPYYAKSTVYGYYYKFTNEGLLTIGDDILVWQTKHYIQEAYLKSAECTREEVESKFKKVMNNLKNKI